jgi:peptidoglycan endopeptidase LytE
MITQSVSHARQSGNFSLNNGSSGRTATYTIKHGDTLSELAHQYGTTVEHLLELNPQITNRNLIYTGDSLNLPASQSYTIQYGDTLSGIALQFGVSVNDLMNANNIANKDIIYPGDKLVIPHNSPGKSSAHSGVNSPDNTTNGSASALINKARSYLGTPYVWGGETPQGFDCSGFTQYMYKTAGINLPRVSSQQGNFGKHIPLSQLKPGDLVAWDNSSRNAGADHVAIYIGNNQVIHAPKPGDHVKISTMFDPQHAWGVEMNV